MHVDSLRLLHFRNYESLEVGFHPRLNLFLGANAQGKTNILESLYYLSTTRSFRAAADEEVLQLGEESGAVEGKLQGEKGQEQIRLEFKRGKNKLLTLNGKKQKLLSSVLGRLPAVIFSPDDLFLVKGGPVLRRRYLDTTIFQLDPAYLGHLQQYERALRQRNSLLRKKDPQMESQLSVWDLPLAQNGALLMVRRLEISQKLSDLAGKALSDLTGGAENFEVKYEPCVPLPNTAEETQAKLLQALQESRREDRARGLTVVGPHRDDLSLWVNGESLRKFGSQGQQRSGALALKLAQLSLLTEECHTSPLILFDDVMAELDENRQAFFLMRLQQGGQAFLTGTSAYDFKAAQAQARVFSVEAGRIKLEQKGP